MKKIFALLLAIVMVMGLATVASADTIGENTDNKTYVSDAKTKAITLKKVYNVVGNTDTALFPDETLKFTVVEKDGAENPDDEPKVTVDDLKITSNGEHIISVNLPVYDTVGVYEYTITENEGSVQGAVYTDAKIDIKVLVTYDYSNKKLASEVVLATPGNNGKVDTFTNTYNVGTMTLKKEVTGNLADSEAYFDIKVTFTATDTVASDIKVTGGSKDANKITIAANEFAATGSVTKTFSLKAGDTLTFQDIPDGVTYKVEEDSRHLLADGETVDPNSKHDEDYKVTYTNQAGEIETNTTTAVKVDNEKSTTVSTGIVMDSVPFVVMAVIAVLGLAAFTAKKRVQE